MKFLLDSNAVIAMLKGHPGFLARLTQYRPADFGIGAIVAHELFYGAHNGQRANETLARLEGLAFEVLEFDREDARAAAQLRARLVLAGTPVGPYDVLIAGQALARGLTVVTHNRREFRRATGLDIEDWE